MFRRPVRCELPDRSVLVQGDQLERHAEGVLDRNWQGTHTIPAFGLYPHQWLWDSGFIAIGLSHVRPERAVRELRRLHEGQWRTGMLPHIIFDPDVRSYWPDPGYWGLPGLAEGAPRDVPTSGITQPSVSPLALLSVVRNAGERVSDAGGLMREFFPKLMAFHRYLMSARDPEGSGLVSIVHPWESGLDNSPAWDEPMGRIEPRDLPPYKRKDVEHVDDAEERPTDETYDRYVHLCERMKRVGYRDEAVYGEAEFLVKDVASSVMLYLSNEALKEIGERIGEDTGEIEEWVERAREGFYKYLYEEEDGLFYPYDLRGGKRLRKRTVMSFMPLALDFLSDKEVDRLVSWMNHSNFCGEGNCDSAAVPSADIAADSFSKVSYWRGPVWLNVNWLITLGLYRRGKMGRANACYEGVLALVWENGFWEFYRPDSGRGLGGRDFSWSAALMIDLLRNEGFRHPSKEEWGRMAAKSGKMS